MPGMEVIRIAFRGSQENLNIVLLFRQSQMP